MMQAIYRVVRAALVLLLMLPGLLQATTVPVLQGRVNDDARVLGDRQAALEARLAAHESRSGDQVVVLTVPDLGGQDIESYANDVFKQWRLGHKGVDNGVLMVVSVRDRRARIEVGYGLEGQLTDVASSQILRYRMHPRFAAGDYAGGVEAGVDGVLGVLDGDAATPPAVSDESPDDIIAREGFWKSGAWMLPLMVALFTLLFGWMASLGGSWWMYLLLGPICIPLLLFLWSWPVAAVAFAVYLLAVAGWRRRRMQRDYQQAAARSSKDSPTRAARRRKRTAQQTSAPSWPPSWGQILLWSGSTAGGSRQRSGRASSHSPDGFSSSDSSSFSSSSSSSDFSGDGGSSGGGGASDSW